MPEVRQIRFEIKRAASCGFQQLRPSGMHRTHCETRWPLRSTGSGARRLLGGGAFCGALSLLLMSQTFTLVDGGARVRLCARVRIAHRFCCQAAARLLDGC